MVGRFVKAIEDTDVEHTTNDVIKDTNIKHITTKLINNTNIKPIIGKAKNDIEFEIDISELVRLAKPLIIRMQSIIWVG